MFLAPPTSDKSLRALARCVQAGKPGTSSGHRSVPHTADLRIEAWAPTRDGCIRQAVLGTVELPRPGIRARGPYRLRRRPRIATTIYWSRCSRRSFICWTPSVKRLSISGCATLTGCRRHIRNDRCEYASSGGCRAEGGVTQRTSVLAGSPRLAMCGNARCVN